MHNPCIRCWLTGVIDASRARRTIARLEAVTGFDFMPFQVNGGPLGYVRVSDVQAATQRYNDREAAGLLPDPETPEELARLGLDYVTDVVADTNGYLQWVEHPVAGRVLELNAHILTSVLVDFDEATSPSTDWPPA